MYDNEDVLWELESKINYTDEIFLQTEKEESVIKYNYEVIVSKIKKTKVKQNSILSGFIFLIKYITTTSVIF